MKNRFLLSMAVFFFASLFSMVHEAEATFTLEVSPRRGTRDIRFEASAPGKFLRNEEVTFTVTSNQNRQYQIIQQVFQPLTNEFGNTIPQNALLEFSPSDTLGRLRTQLETPVTMGQQQVYTSNGSGTSDEFVLVFNVAVPENQPGGTYRAQMSFILEAVDGGLRSVQNLDVIVDIRPSLRVDVQNAQTGGRSLEFKISKEKLHAEAMLNLHIQNNLGQLKVTQQMDAFVSKDGEALDEEVLKFFVVAQGAQASISTPEAVSLSPKVIYVSELSHNETVVQLQYMFSSEVLLRAGIYNGNILLKVDPPAGSPGQPKSFVIPVKIDIEPLFYLDVKTQDGLGAFNFGILRPGFEQRRQKVTLQIFSNLGQPYQVSQILPRGLASEQGAVLPAESLMYATEPATTGLVSSLAPMTVREGESQIFTSDQKGTPETLNLEYSLQAPKGARAGSYNSGIKYSITTL